MEIDENKKLKYFISSNQTARNIILQFGNFLLNKLDQNFEFEGMFKVNICNFMVTGGNIKNKPLCSITQLTVLLLYVAM
tara:strand:- start:27 stop:263 length:237 start_codon:yes stop_codon:yes gene_type:complete